MFAVARRAYVKCGIGIVVAGQVPGRIEVALDRLAGIVDILPPAIRAFRSAVRLMIEIDRSIVRR